MKQATYKSTLGLDTLKANEIAEAALAASRQAWLAGLGAAALTRAWVRNEGGHTFRALVKQGSTVERQAIRAVGNRIEASIAGATSLWNEGRATVLTSVSDIANAAAVALPKIRVAAWSPQSPLFRFVQATGIAVKATARSKRSASSKRRSGTQAKAAGSRRARTANARATAVRRIQRTIKKAK